MENRDIALIEQLLPTHPELKRLMDEHAELEKQLDELGRHSYLSQPEIVEQRRLKKKKLIGRDRIEKILTEHR